MSESNQPTHLEGHCLCRAIKLKVPHPSIKSPIMTFVCHCLDCQRNAGGPCQAVATYPKDDVTIIDPEKVLGTYVIPGAETLSGLQKPKLFCSRCGCTIMTIPQKWGGNRVVVRTTLFDGLGDNLLVPTEEWFVKDKRHWVKDLDGAKQYEKSRHVD